MKRRHYLLALASASLLTFHAEANEPKAPYPSKPITIVVPYPVRGQGDVMARLIGERLSTRLGQPIIVENRPGASGMLGAQRVARAKGDGYTLLMGQTGEMAVNASVMKAPGYALTDFKPIVRVVDAPLLLVARADAPFSDARSLIEAARARPGSISHAITGTATPARLAAEALMRGTGTTILNTPYTSAGQAMTDVLAGHIHLFFVSTSAALPQIRAGKIKALATATEHRVGALPNVPTIAEQVVPGFSYTLWAGMLAPAQTLDSIIKLLNKEVNEFLSEPATRARLDADGSAVAPNSPAEFGAFLQKETRKYEALVEAAGIQAE